MGLVIRFMKKKFQQNLCYSELLIFYCWIYEVLRDKLTDQRFNFNFSIWQKINGLTFNEVNKFINGLWVNINLPTTDDGHWNNAMGPTS